MKAFRKLFNPPENQARARLVKKCCAYAAWRGASPAYNRPPAVVRLLSDCTLPPIDPSSRMPLYGITIVTSAFLLFLVQPIVAKQILPWFGGTAAVWTVCVVFFQGLLLAGYAYAHGITRLSPRTQSRIHLALLALSVATLPIVASPAWKPGPADDPTWRIVGLLIATIGAPYFLLSSTGPLVQRWVADDRGLAVPPARVYRLFALSNFGSLVGLLAYPFAIEPFASLRVQSWTWSAGYALFAVACGACAWRARLAVPAAIDAHDDVPPPTIARRVFWIVCAGLGSMLLLALTNHVTQNIASIPFLWVLPLTLYLLSFVIVFEGRGGRGFYVRRWWLGPVMAGLVAMAWAMSAYRGVLSVYVAVPIFCVGLLLACVFCHGELAASKPPPRYLTQFYLCLSAGGALGGLFVALVAPALFKNYWETPIALCGFALLGVVTLRREFSADRIGAWIAGGFLAVFATLAALLAGGGATFDAARAYLPGADATWVSFALIAVAALVFLAATLRRWPVAIVATALVCVGFHSVKYYRFLSEDTLVATRNFYGALRVKESGTGEERRRDLLHGVILHGDQYLADDKRRKPTTYYGPASGIAYALRDLRPDGAPLDVAMIGLGSGTLTAWGRAGDRYRIYDINPAMVDIAHRDFTYLADSPAAKTIVMGDARLSMERELDRGDAVPFDVIAVDAFSSDSIPVHLITREALGVFERHLKPDGIVAFHVSNRFLKLAPVVQQLAQDAGLQVVDIVDDPDDDDYASSEWVLVTRNESFLHNPVIEKAATPIDPIRGLSMWTDQFNNLFQILK
jgi:SAM-dependent methyltransferase